MPKCCPLMKYVIGQDLDMSNARRHHQKQLASTHTQMRALAAALPCCQQIRSVVIMISCAQAGDRDVGHGDETECEHNRSLPPFQAADVAHSCPLPCPAVPGQPHCCHVGTLRACGRLHSQAQAPGDLRLGADWICGGAGLPEAFLAEGWPGRHCTLPVNHF